MIGGESAEMINISELQSRIKRCGYTFGNIALELSAKGQRVTEREVRDIVFGRCIPSWDHLVRIAILLQCTPLELITKGDNT